MGADNGAHEHNEVFDLDTLERGVTKELFAFAAGGHTFHMADPEALDWHTQAAFTDGDLVAIMPTLLGDDWEAFDQLEMPAWKLERLMTAWAKHYGIAVPELEASSTSSKPTVKPSRRTSGGTTKSGSRTSQRAR